MLIVIDENRARVVESGALRKIISLLEDTTLLPYALAVVFNLSLDYGK